MAEKIIKNAQGKRKKMPKAYVYKKTEKMIAATGSEWPSFRLMWPLSLYKEWYVYEKHTKKTKAKTFEDWFDLKKYAEPLQDDDVKVIKKKRNKLVLEFNLNHDLKRLGMNFLKEITKHKANYTYHSLAKKQPDIKAIDFTLKASKKRRQAFSLKEKGYKNHQIAYKLGFIDEDLFKWKEATRAKKAEFKEKYPKEDYDFKQLYKTAERRVQRHITDCKKTLANVKKGSFP